MSYRHRRVHADHIAFLNQQLARLIAEFFDLVFGYRTACAQLRDGSVMVQRMLGRRWEDDPYLSRSLMAPVAR